MGKPRVRHPAGALSTAGQRAWALIGLLIVLGVVVWALGLVRLVIFALLIALFPAAMLSPLAEWLRRRGVPGPLIGIGLILGLFGVLGLLGWLVVPRFIDQFPALMESLEEAIDQIDEALAADDLPVDVPVESVSGAVDRAMDAIGGGEGVLGTGWEYVRSAFDVVAGFLLGLVALFFYLKDGGRIWAGIADLLPRDTRRHADRVGGIVWWTLGAYFRGQILVALFDAIGIGLGLWLLGVPLALPLAVIVLVGGLFPIVGAFVSGLLAVLVALADQGIGTALLVLGLVLLVQQLEGNVLEPLILSKAVSLHPLLVVSAVSAGALLLGVVGAFLAVPLAAVLARVVDYVRGRSPGGEDEEASDDGAGRDEPGAGDDVEGDDVGGDHPRDEGPAVDRAHHAGATALDAAHDATHDAAGGAQHGARRRQPG